MPSLVIIGASGHGRELCCLAMDCGWQVAGFYDDHQPDGDVLARLGVPWLGSIDHCQPTPLLGHFVLGLGNGSLRRELAHRLTARGWRPVSLVHPTATVGRDVRHGPGLVICAQASITTNVQVGAHVHLNRGSTVGHDCVLGDFATINPMGCVSGNVTLAEGVTVGASAVINQGLTVGAHTVIGSGAAVVRSLPAHVVAVGVPARAIVVPRPANSPPTMSQVPAPRI